jgi:lipopolysaccharide biosynthesis glycosyltransferase
MLDVAHRDQIHIVCCSNENYIPLTATMLMSLARNHKSDELLNVYIINNGISDLNKQTIEDLPFGEGLAIHWSEIDPQAIPSILEIPERYTSIPCHYYRLLMPYLLPKSVTKAIYLDVDLIILSDISELWNLDFQDNIVWATQDFLGYCGNAIPNCFELGINPNAKYFNSGVLLVDLEKWREQNISKKVIACRFSNEEAVVAAKYYSHDQFGLNVILVDQWQELDPLWNYSPGPGSSELTPFIVHYYGDVKPWNQKCKEEFRQHFIDYLNQTPYQDHFKDLLEPYLCVT